MTVFDPSFWDRHFVTLESDAKRTLIPTMKEASVFTLICPKGLDVKIAVELGIAVYLDKPILVLVPPGREPSEHLQRVADMILGVPEDPSLWPAMVDIASRKLAP